MWAWLGEWSKPRLRNGSRGVELRARIFPRNQTTPVLPLSHLLLLSNHRILTPHHSLTMSSVAELKAKGNADFAAKRYEEAISHYTAAIEAAKGEADAPHVLYSNRSACYSGLKNYEQALADAEKVSGTHKLMAMYTALLGAVD